VDNKLRQTASRFSGPFSGFRLKRFYKKIIGKEKLCFDVGAVDGQHTEAWLKLDAKIVCIAADEVAFEDLQKQFEEDDALTLVPAMPNLDILITRHGLPDFCRITSVYDTENILNGLSKPVKGLSFPYDINNLTTAMNCINRLEQIGDYEFNWSYGRSLELAKKWTSPTGMRPVLHGFSENYRSGDIYVRWRVPRS